jgi:predicted nucleic acid-binding protein
MGRVLVDTSAWVEAIRRQGEAGVAGMVRNAVAAGRGGALRPVLLELWNGAQSEDERQLRELERVLDRAPITEEGWNTACALARSCRRSGVSAPAMDLLIAACANSTGWRSCTATRTSTRSNAPTTAAAAA